ncbi:MAG: glutathione S-transferase family protein [Pseudomonadota bacterium]|nr:glutathione S-transferase family protein [Pseudomonadota bacterium]
MLNNAASTVLIGLVNMLALYHNSMSSCSQKIRLALAEKGLDWESRHLNLRAGDAQTPEYLRLNPKGVVPTLEHDGHIVPESSIILEYLEDAFPEHSLRPKDPHDLARVRLWAKRLDEGHHDLATSVLSSGVAFRHQFLSKGREKFEAQNEKVPDPVKRERRREVVLQGLDAQIFKTAIQMWVDLLNDLERFLDQSEWLAGQHYSIADAAYTPYITRLEHLSSLGFLHGRPALTKWYDKVRKRANYEEAIVKWNDETYITLMREKGTEAWPRIEAMIGEFS